MEEKEEYTQEQLDNLIQQRQELDQKIEDVQAHLRDKTIGSLEKKYRKLLVGKILVTVSDWGVGDFTCRYISSIGITEDFRGTKEIKLFVKSFTLDSRKDAPEIKDECIPKRFEDIPTTANEPVEGFLLCDVDSLLKASGTQRKYLDDCIKKHLTEISKRAEEKVKNYIKDVKQSLKLAKTHEAEESEEDDAEPQPMTIEEYTAVCKKYIPECILKDEGTCGLMCYKGKVELSYALVSRLPDGRYAVYDHWRDCTITKDEQYMIDYLKRHSTVKEKEIPHDSRRGN